MITFLSFTLGFVCGFVAGYFFTRSKKGSIDKTIIDIRLAQEIIKRDFNELRTQVNDLLECITPPQPKATPSDEVKWDD